MKLRTNYHRDTGTLSLAFKHSESDGVFASVSSHNTIWDMKPEQWLEIIGELRQAIDRIQLTETPEATDAELAAKIEQHGGAT